MGRDNVKIDITFSLWIHSWAKLRAELIQSIYDSPLRISCKPVDIVSKGFTLINTVDMDI